MFPNVAISYYTQTTGTSAILLTTSTRTILGVSLTFDGANDATLSCGSSPSLPFFKGYNGGDISSPLNYVCDGAVTYTSTGSNLTSVHLVYVPYNRTTTTTAETFVGISGNIAASISTSSPLTVTASDFSYMVVVLLVIAALLAFDFARRLFGRMTS